MEVDNGDDLMEVDNDDDLMEIDDENDLRKVHLMEFDGINGDIDNKDLI